MKRWKSITLSWQHTIHLIILISENTRIIFLLPPTLNSLSFLSLSLISISKATKQENGTLTFFTKACSMRSVPMSWYTNPSHVGPLDQGWLYRPWNVYMGKASPSARHVFGCVSKIIKIASIGGKLWGICAHVIGYVTIPHKDCKYWWKDLMNLRACDRICYHTWFQYWWKALMNLRMW